MHITITGMLGSGKSTVCRIISEQTGYEVYSTGKIQRQVAAQKGISTLELNKMMSDNTELDNIIDNETVRISDAVKDRIILFDSRMAWFFVKQSYKVFLTVDPLVAAQRVAKADRGGVEDYTDVNEAKQKLLERAAAEHERFIKIYGADYWDYSNYDLVLDATWHDPHTLAGIITGQFAMFTESDEQQSAILMSPRSLYPAYIAGKRKKQIDKKCWNAANVRIVADNHYNYVIKGHSVVLRALENRTEFITVLYNKDIKSSELTVASDSLSLFENSGQFNYPSLPDNVI
ncbi:MAG TPA: cytidylate kinase family protein [Clostridia bacterium]|jgi:cytidylate kinase|nr:cytidylate kinase family protein [Clostridia bacterium]HQC69142.1 cytidylate kinase family protein [Clostridia bacterium]